MYTSTMRLVSVMVTVIVMDSFLSSVDASGNIEHKAYIYVKGLGEGM